MTQIYQHLQSTKENLELPKTKTPPTRKSPKSLVIYGPPKIGKTSILAQLEDCLILDLEDGTDMVESLKVKINNLDELSTVGKAIISAGKPYKYIAVDTVTQLEVWCEDLATRMYKETAMGKNFDKEGKGLSVLSLPNGGGYLYLRLAYKLWRDRLSQLAERIIYVGHLKDKMLEKEGKEVASGDIDLTGKVRSIVCSDADAIGYIFRERHHHDKLCFWRECQCRL